jgi:hypothetical protein
MVRKKDGSWRPCGDYHQLNLQAVEDKYPLPNMADLVVRLDGCNISVSWIYARAIFRCLSPLPTFPRRRSLHPSGCSSSCACLSAYEMQG